MAESENINKVQQLLNTLGKAYLEKGNYQGAVEKLEKALELGVADRTSYRCLCKAYLHMGRRDKTAIDVYERVLRYEPNNKELCQILAEHYLKEGRDDESAVEVYRRALSNDPSQKFILLKILEIDFKKGDYENAINRAQEAVREGRAMPEALSMYLRICWQIDAYSETVRFLENMLSKKLEGVLLIGLCRTLIRQERWNRMQDQSFSLNINSCKFCATFLHATRRVYTIDDLLLYLDIRRLLCDSINILGIDDEKLTNALQSTGLTPQQWLDIDIRSDVFDKLAFGLGERADLSSEEKEKKQNQLKEQLVEKFPSLNLLAVFYLSNYAELLANFGRKIIKRISQTFSSICSIQLEKKNLTFMWLGDDCVILLTNKHDSVIAAAQSILEKLDRYNSVQESDEKVQVQVCLHRFDQAMQSGLNHLVDEIANILQLSRLGQTKKGSESSRVESSKQRIIVTESVNEVIHNSNFSTRPLGGFRAKPWTEKIGVCELFWRNTLKSIDLGELKRLGRFEVLEKILQTEKRVVYKARDLQLNRLVILKAVLMNVANGIDLAKLEKEFLSQARNLGRLHHPNLAVVYEVGQDAGLLYTAREYLEGTTLAYKMSATNVMLKRHLLENMTHVCRGLGYAHRMTTVHGDLRPSNIYISDVGETKVADFGIPILRQYLDASDTESKEKAYYIPPEFIQHNQLDTRGDIFQLGVIIYQLLTGELPFKGETHEEIYRQITSNSVLIPSRLVDGIPEEFDEMVSRSLQKEPKDRYQDISELENDLQTVLHSETLLEINGWN